jgi:hypothetical protein
VSSKGWLEKSKADLKDQFEIHYAHPQQSSVSDTPAEPSAAGSPVKFNIFARYGARSTSSVVSNNELEDYFRLTREKLRIVSIILPECLVYLGLKVGSEYVPNEYKKQTCGPRVITRVVELREVVTQFPMCGHKSLKKGRVCRG